MLVTDKYVYGQRRNVVDAATALWDAKRPLKQEKLQYSALPLYHKKLNACLAYADQSLAGGNFHIIRMSRSVHPIAAPK